MESITILADEETTLTARVESFAAMSCQWEIFVPGAELWVAVDGYDELDCAVSKALVGSVLDSKGRARLRCTVMDKDGTSHTSDTVIVTVSEETAVSQQKVEPVYYPGELGEAEVIDLVEETTPAAPAVSALPVAAEGNDDTTGGTATVEVKYIFLDKSIANTSTKYNVPLNELFVTQVTLPTIVGYIPFIYNPATNATYYDEASHRLYFADGTSRQATSADKDYNEKLPGSYQVRFDPVTKNETVTIVYLPAMVKYTVVHYTENLSTASGKSSYTVHSSYEHMGLTGYPVPDNLAADHSIEGFTAMDYVRLNVAATGNTEIHIYHHRNYYLVDFDCNGPDNVNYGVKPVFVRYETKVTVPNPVRPGYNFAGWTLTGYGRTETVWNAPTAEQVTTYAMVNRTVTVPASDLRYQAGWSQDDSYYTVVYWREAESVYGNTEVRYEYWGSEIIGGKAYEGGSVATDGTVLSGATLDYTKYTKVPADISTVTHDDNTFDKAQYFTYNEEKTAEANTGSALVHGDGTSVINIYFDRKSYNLKFYYAASTTSGNSTTYKVIGGSTYGFGASATQSTGDDARLFGRILSNETKTAGEYPVGDVLALPELNDNGDAKGYTIGTESYTAESGSNRGTTYTMYYIAFQAKYGMNISSMWPTDVFGSVTTSETYTKGKYSSNIAWMSAWNGEHHVYYSQHNSNQTIKGKYNKLGYQILWDNVSNKSVASTAADESELSVGGLTSNGGTVSYLCFWENGANVSWSVPELYRYNIWLECLDQTKHTEAGAEEKTFNGSTKWYYPSEHYNTVDDSDVKNQTAPPIQGFQCISGPVERDQKPNYNTTEYVDAFNVDFYYDRNEYELTFNNHGEILTLKDAQGNDMDKVTIRYGVVLNPEWGSDVSLDENYLPKSMEKGGYVFEGWYTSSTFAPSTKFTFDNNTSMPAEDLYLYANWVPKEHLVYVYYDQAHAADTQNSIYGNTEKAVISDGVKVLHGEKSPTPEEPDFNVNAPFLGWFYCNNYDENGNYLGYEETLEEAWSFDSMDVTHDLVIYAKYNYAFMTNYVIHFYQKQWDESTKTWVEPAAGQEKKVADDITDIGVAGDHVLVKAAVGEDLYESHRTHWFPDPYSDSLQLSTVQGQVTERIIWYTKQASVSYTVKYVDKDGNELRDPKVMPDNIYSYVTETYQYIPGYVPDAYQKSLAVSTAEDAQNIITFVYTAQTEQTKQTVYRVEHYVESVDGTYVLHSDRVIEGTAIIGTELKLLTGAKENPDVTEIPGATESKSEAFKWNIDKTVVTSGGSNYTGFTADENGVTVNKMPDEGVLVKLYYDRESYKYEIHYHEVDKDTAADYKHDADLYKVYEGYAKYGTTLILNPVRIPGYHTVGAGENAALTIGMVKENNVYTYWYQEDQITVNYVVVGGGTLSKETGTGGAITGVPEGSVARADPGYTFVGWYLNEACTLPADQSWVKENVTVNGLTGTKLTPGKVAYSSTDTETQVYKSATYYAKFVRNTADLTIATDFPANNDYRQVDGSQTFIFLIQGTGDNAHISLTVTLHERETKTIADLPVGTYTVTELDSSAWRYDTTERSKTVELQPDQTNSVTFLETRNQSCWLDGNASQAVNNFKPIGDQEQEGGA